MKSILTFFLGILFANLILLPINAKADDPLPPPKDYSISSANGKYKAFFQVKEKKTTIYKIDKSSGESNKTKFWEMDRWFRNTFLSNDGENLIVAYEGTNLLSQDYKINEVMISFYDKGNLLNEINLNQLIEKPIPENLEKTVSHYRWGSTYGLNEKQVFEVNIIKKKKYLFNIKTGLLLKGNFYIPTDESATPTSNLPTNTNPDNAVKNKIPTDKEKKTKGCSGTVLGIIGFTFLATTLKASN